LLASDDEVKRLGRFDQRGVALIGVERKQTALDVFVVATAFTAGDLFIVLPILIQACKDLLERHRLVDESTKMLPDVIVPTSFNFPHTGKLLSISFILFAGWFADAAVSVTDYPRLALMGLLTFFGSLSAAVPFLLDLFRIPADTFQLFLATGVVNSRFGSLLAAVHTVLKKDAVSRSGKARGIRKVKTKARHHRPMRTAPALKPSILT
jgi:hypothetical protein